MTGIQLAAAFGVLIGLGITLVVAHLVPAAADPVDVVRRYSPESVRERAAVRTEVSSSGMADRLGLWAMKQMPAPLWGKTPTKELTLLRIPVHRHYGTKTLFAILGLLLPPLVTYLFMVISLVPVPVVLPLGASLALAGFMFMIPDLSVRSDARFARADFARSLGSYIDLVALERLSGAGARQAMENAADVGDGWMFRRISEVLQRSRWNGIAPWDALAELSEDLNLPELSDMADVMRMTGEGSQVYESLRARSDAMRSAMLNTERTKANAVSERMNMPMSMLGIVFMVILVTPALLRVLEGA